MHFSEVIKLSNLRAEALILYALSKTEQCTALLQGKKNNILNHFFNCKFTYFKTNSFSLRWHFHVGLIFQIPQLSPYWVFCLSRAVSESHWRATLFHVKMLCENRLLSLQPFMRIWLITPRVSKKLCLWQKCYQQISWQKKSSQTYHIVVEASHSACIDFHRFVLFLSVQTTSISRIFGGNKIRIYSSKRSMEKHLGPDTEG